MSNYIISDAAKIINVENHVLRNWEDELSLHIPRNNLGHRIYTDDNILQLKTIKKLKYYGFSLKHIKSLLPYFHQIDTLSTKELLSLKDNFFTILHQAPSYHTHNNLTTIPNPSTPHNPLYKTSTSDNSLYKTSTPENSTPSEPTYTNLQSINKLKPLVHYIIVDFITTILTSKDNPLQNTTHHPSNTF